MHAIDQQIRRIRSDIPAPREGLKEEEIIDLIRRVGGPRTAMNIKKSASDFEKSRIPFLFSTIDSVAVLEVLANDIDSAVLKLLNEKSAS